MRLEGIFKRRDLTSGSIFRNLIFTTIPLWIGTLVYIPLPTWELYLIGKLGSEVIAALAIGGAGLMLFLTAVLGVSNIAIALIGNLIGQKDYQAANRLAKEILTITFLISIILAIIGYFVTPGLLSLLSVEKEVSAFAISYLNFSG